MTQLSDFAIGVAGGAMSLFLANRFWYPAPDVEGVALGLLLAGIFFAGALPAIIISRLISHD